MEDTMAETPPEPSFKESPELVRIPASRLDTRSDAEITEFLLRHQPVTSEKNLWTYWHAGFLAMRPWVRRNVLGWVRRLGPGWTVRVLDDVPGSPANAARYLPAEDLPEAFRSGAMTGPYAGVHGSDMVRLPLIYRHGGVWLDAGTTLFRHLDAICWDAICDPGTPYEIAGFAPGTEPGNDVVMNGFVAARRGNGFVRRWHDVFAAIWSDHGGTDCVGLRHHPLLRQVKKVQVPLEMQVKFGIDNDLMNDYVAQVLSFKRVRMLRDPADGFDGAAYWERHAYVLPVQETFLAQIMTGFDGQRQFDLLALPRRDGARGEGRTAEEEEAEKLVHALLSGAATLKLSHGLKNNRLVHLAKLWDLPEHADADVAPGTYAAYLRWGSVHLEQTRALEPQTVRCDGPVLEAGLLEVVDDAE